MITTNVEMQFFNIDNGKGLAVRLDTHYSTTSGGEETKRIIQYIYHNSSALSEEEAKAVPAGVHMEEHEQICRKNISTLIESGYHLHKDIDIPIIIFSEHSNCNLMLIERTMPVTIAVHRQ